MVQTLTRTAAGPGLSKKSPMFSSAEKPLVARHYVMDFDTSNYVVGGESLQRIWDDFNQVLHVCAEQKDTNTAADRRSFTVDHAAKVLLVYDAFNTEETATDQTVLAVSLMAFGY